MKMTTGIIVTILLVFFISRLWYKKIKGEKNSEKPKTIYDNKEAEKFVKRLDELGYFKYTDQKDLDTLKSTFIKEFDPQGELSCTWDETTFLPIDFRYYLCDGETVYEQGGIIELLKELKPVFDKMNFKCEVTKHVEVWDENTKDLNHSIAINGTEYKIFKNFKEYGWGEAPFRIAEILNIELRKQNKDEQIYLVNGGNDGRLSLLTEEQYKYIYNVYTDKKWKPLEINEWAKEFEVKYIKLD
jgi:hypothetical protein